MGIEGTRLGLLNVSIDGDLGNRRAEETPARGRLPHGTDEIFLGAIFEDVADGTVLERLGNEGTAAVHGKDHNTRARRPLANNPQHFQAAESRHHQVENQDIGFQSFR